MTELVVWEEGEEAKHGWKKETPSTFCPHAIPTCSPNFISRDWPHCSRGRKMMAKEDPLFSPESVRLVYVFSTRTRQSPSRLSDFSIRLDSNYPLPTDDRGDYEGLSVRDFLSPLGFIIRYNMHVRSAEVYACRGLCNFRAVIDATQC